jgi:hypothetical protein
MRREDVSVERLAAALLFRDASARGGLTHQWAFVRAVLILEALSRGDELAPRMLTRALHGALCQSTDPKAPAHMASYHQKEAEKLLADLADTEQLAELFSSYDGYNRQPPSTDEHESVADRGEP